jgi:LPS export ABC transporter protein LptC
MQEIKRRKAIGIGLRAWLPKVARVFAVMLLVTGIAFVVVSIYRQSGNSVFRMRGGEPELARTVERVVEGYEQRITEGDRLRLYLRAAREITYTDGHHELEDVHLEVYPNEGDRPDQITAQRAVYEPEQSQVTFAGSVHIETRDRLIADTERLVYDHRNETAEVSAPVTFARENVRGRADAATLDSKNKRLNLRGGVEITVEPEANAGNRNPGRSRPVVIRAPRGDFDQNVMRLVFSGGASAEQDADLMRGETLSGQLNEQKRLRQIEARGNSYLRTTDEGRATEIHSVDMDFFFDTDQQLERAVAVRDVRARSLDSDSQMELSGANTANVDFVALNERSLLREVRADGRPRMTLSAPQSQANNPQAANKRLTADAVRMVWRANGRDIERAEAVGNAELVVEPVRASATADRKTLTAPRFDCDFYETGNLARTFTATGGARAIIEPLQPSEMRGTKTITSQQMTSVFGRETQDVERVDAQTDARFNERDRNGQAQNISYTTADEIVRMRGGEPLVWDARARIRANELDSDLRNRVTVGRGRTTTTYYNQAQTNGATPFENATSPVFITANAVEFQHDSGVAIYTGQARAWQDDNFVRADRIILRRDQKRMEGEGNVQSALYNARRQTGNAGGEVVPVFATAARMFYSESERLLHYETNVDIRQGTERITGEAADVFMQREANVVERTVAERNVVVTQPGKRGTGDRAEYVAASETVVLTGNPARVEDTAQGMSESRRLTVFLRENRVVSGGGANAGRQNTGRVRSSHRVRRQP